MFRVDMVPKHRERMALVTCPECAALHCSYLQTFVPPASHPLPDSKSQPSLGTPAKGHLLPGLLQTLPAGRTCPFACVLAVVSPSPP